VAPRHAGLLAALAAVWGGSYLLIKYALEDLEPLVIVCSRCAIAAAVLAVVLRPAGVRVAYADLRARPGTALGLGALAIAVPFTLITFGELEVPSGLTAVLIAPASLFVAAFAPFLDRSEQVDGRAAGGMLVGLAGVALLVGVESVQSLGELLGALAILGSAASYALSGFVVKGSYRGMSPVTTSLISTTMATALTLPGALATAPGALPGLRATLAVLALGVVGTALAFIIFYRLIAEIGAGRAALVSYLAPGVALVYGALLLDERITWAALAGLGLILAGVAIAARRRAVARPAGAPARA